MMVVYFVGLISIGFFPKKSLTLDLTSIHTSVLESCAFLAVEFNKLWFIRMYVELEWV
jgi:hypothetical protein